MRASTMLRLTALVLCSVAFVSAGNAQTIAITGGTVYPVSGPKIGRAHV